MSEAQVTTRRDAPSGWRIEQAVATWQAVRSRLLQEDPSLENDEAAVKELLGEEEGDVRDILARLLRAAVHAESMATGAAARIMDMKERQERYGKRRDIARGAAFAVMDILGEKKVELPDLTASLRQGKPKLAITNEAAVMTQDRFVRVARSIDGEAVRAALQDGEIIEGVEMQPGLPSLTIRTR